MRALRTLGVVSLGLVAAAFLSYGSWLLVTADEGDGGRQPVGVLSLIIGVLVVMPLLARSLRSR